MDRMMVRAVARSLAALVVVAGAGLVVGQLSACNTVKGVGTDIHNVGAAGQNAISGNRSTSGASGGTSTSDSSGSH